MKTTGSRTTGPRPGWFIHVYGNTATPITYGLPTAAFTLQEHVDFLRQGLAGPQSLNYLAPYRKSLLICYLEDWGKEIVRLFIIMERNPEVYYFLVFRPLLLCPGDTHTHTHTHTHTLAGS